MNTFGHNFKVEIFGESHGECIGAVMDGVPAGLALCTEDFKADIDRRRSGAPGTTPRREADKPEIVSGVYNGHTTGAPLTVIFRNENARSSDYEELKSVPRPGHADYVAGVKFGGYNDPRGGGHFSGRLTLPLVAAGVVAKKILAGAVAAKSHCNALEEGSDAVRVNARLIEVGGINAENMKEVQERFDAAAREGDSLGGIVECVVENVPLGLGEPFFDSVESLISHAVFSIPGVRGIEFGDGFAASKMLGSEHNDPFGPACGEIRDIGADVGQAKADTTLKTVGPGGNCPTGNNIVNNGIAGRKALPTKNGSGGINGGITNGAPIIFRVAFKPTSSIAKTQRTLNIETGEQTELNVKGRHDVCFALRAPVIVEAAAAIVLADLMSGHSIGRI